MNETIQELKEIIETFSKKIELIDDAEFSAKPNSEKWSKKEVLGHLIDSAQNNLRRFICAQSEKRPSTIVYDQDFWVAINTYNELPKEDIITYWKLINTQICTVLKNTPETNYMLTSDTGKDGQRLQSIGWLAPDYVKHLKHHLNQIIPESFDITYP